MARRKSVSNPFSTGGGGAHFEAYVQALFVTLMLTGGHAPCLPCWPIVEIRLQGKIDGFDIDDLIVVVKDPHTKERRKLLGQVKHSIRVNPRSRLFGEVMQAAWNDFNNPRVFSRGKDVIALITGPLSETDEHNVQWLLNQARRADDVDTFFRNVDQARFSPPKSCKKLGAIQDHLKIANGGNEVPREELYSFLRHLYLLDYDLGDEFGVVLSLLHSHISQFQRRNPEWVWSRIVDMVQIWNKDAGTITRDSLPQDLLEVFRPKIVTEMPEALKTPQERPKANWMQHPDANYLALATLIGAWNEKSKCDIDAVTQLLRMDYDTWLEKAREILHYPKSPLSLKNGIWRVSNRAELWALLGQRILDQDLDIFGSLAVTLLKERDPAFELPAEERYAASAYGKDLSHSRVLREGIAEGLAILGNRPDVCCSCSMIKAETTAVLAIREILGKADWVIWGSLYHLLPLLAEAASGEFLDAVEDALQMIPCPFDRLLEQEGKGIFSRNYLTGLLWALEGLAWDEQYLVRVCNVLGELGSRDPGGQWANRPSESLATILLPWLPQTLASVEKRKVAVQTLLRECPDAAWNLILQLLPGQHQTSSGSYKPKWRRTVPDDWKEGVTHQEYWQQVSLYSELAVDAAGHDIDRLSGLIDHLDSLPRPVFDKLIEALTSQPISELPEDQRLSLWTHLAKFARRHRRFSDAEWVLPDELITRIEDAAEKLAPTNPLNLYQHLFTDRDFDLYEENGNWKEQRKRLDERRDAAIGEIFRQNGTDGVVRFAESVVSPDQVGYALGAVLDDAIERDLLPHFLDRTDNKHRALVGGLIWRRFHTSGWSWCDSIEKSGWSPGQVGHFLACLPFTKGTWDRASEWLKENQVEYWSRASANAYQADGDLSTAIDKLIEHGRPWSAINCLGIMHLTEQPISAKQCVRALLAAGSSNESANSMDLYNVAELIRLLQSEASVAQEDLFAVEWAYLPLLDRRSGVAPKLLESRLASDPKFFSQVVQLVYRSKRKDQSSGESTERLRVIARNAWRLLHGWRTPPGLHEDGGFDAKYFLEWLQQVKNLCMESGHLEVALGKIGEVLIYAPSDPDGLWIHKAVAAALNARDAEDMRSGFRRGAVNSRGAYWEDPSGRSEKALAEQFRRKAEDVENAGFHRFAVTLRDLAERYEREAKRVVDEYEDRDDE